MANEKLLRYLQSTIDLKKTGPWKQKACSKIMVPPKRQNKRVTDPNDTESAVQKEVLQQAKLMNILLFRQQSGMIWAGPHPVHLAPIGAADLTGIIPRGKYKGLRLEVEVKKRYGGIHTEEQKKWRALMTRMNGIYLLVHSGEEFAEQVSQYL